MTTTTTPLSLILSTPLVWFVRGCDGENAKPIRKAVEELFTQNASANTSLSRRLRKGRRPRRMDTNGLDTEAIWKLLQLWDKDVLMHCESALTALEEKQQQSEHLDQVLNDDDDRQLPTMYNDKDFKDPLLDDEVFHVAEMDEFAEELERKLELEMMEQEKQAQEALGKRELSNTMSDELSSSDDDELGLDNPTPNKDEEDSYDGEESDEEGDEDDGNMEHDDDDDDDDDEKILMDLYEEGGLPDNEDDDDDDNDEDAANMTYADFFGTGNKLSSSKSKTARTKSHDLDTSSEKEEDEDEQQQQQQQPTTFKTSRQTISQRIAELEAEAMGDKPWYLKGEVTMKTRPEDSLLEHETLGVAYGGISTAPALSQDVAREIEQIIKHRIATSTFNNLDVGDRIKQQESSEQPAELVSNEKSKQGLADIYAREFEERALNQVSKSHLEQEKDREEIRELFTILCSKLDALSNFHFTPKPITKSSSASEKPQEIAALVAEDIIPTTEVGAISRLAPEEAVAPKHGLGKSRAEMEPEERRALRRNDKEARRKRKATDSLTDKDKKEEAKLEKKRRKKELADKSALESKNGMDWSSSGQAFKHMMLNETKKQ